jgi:hypothetical protein
MQSMTHNVPMLRDRSRSIYVRECHFIDMYATCSEAVSMVGDLVDQS